MKLTDNDSRKQEPFLCRASSEILCCPMQMAHLNHLCGPKNKTNYHKKVLLVWKLKNSRSKNIVIQIFQKDATNL